MGSTQRIIILGSTGSIGRSTLRVVEHLNREAGGVRFEVVGLAAGANADLALQQARQLGVGRVAVAQGAQGDCEQGGVRTITGPDAAARLVRETDADLVVSAIVGSAGLAATLAAIESGKDVALANKETLVAAGSLVMRRVKERGVRLLPVDSEHAAIHQCLAARSGCGMAEVTRITLTGSGGPLRTWSAERIAKASVEEALAHPTWAMGAKITIDSATLMNKTLELIEAHHLFGANAEQLDVLIHPQSIVHGFVEFADGSVVAQMGMPDMAGPIQYALTHPARNAGCVKRLDLTALGRLEFERPDDARFPAIRLARQVIERSGTTAGAILNAANEEAVKAFLSTRIAFPRIAEITAEALEAFRVDEAGSLEAIEEADRKGREYVGSRVSA